MSKSIGRKVAFGVILATQVGMGIAQRSYGWMSTDCDRGTDQPVKCIENLMARYPDSGNAWPELGIQVGKSLVAHTNAFLQVSPQRPVEFDAWLRDLPRSTFAILEPESSIEAELEAAYLNKLRELSLAALSTVPRNDPQIRLASRLRDVLKTVKVEASGKDPLGWKCQPCDRDGAAPAECIESAYGNVL